MSSTYTIPTLFDIKPPVLADNEQVSFYEARATSNKQDKGHVGVGGNFVGFKQYNRKQWSQVIAFITKHHNQPYCSVDATIEVTEYHEEEDYHYTASTYRYHTVFLRDDSLAE